MSLISFLYRFVFRGIGIVLVIGMLTMLALAIRSQLNQAEREHRPVTRTPSGETRGRQ